MSLSTDYADFRIKWLIGLLLRWTSREQGENFEFRIVDFEFSGPGSITFPSSGRCIRTSSIEFSPVKFAIRNSQFAIRNPKFSLRNLRNLWMRHCPHSEFERLMAEPNRRWYSSDVMKAQTIAR